ncbi:MAG: hypothetical protein B6U88_01090 [Candidatus Aenigmarchaeota archaeon ex4484_56]|nr:MAG: hypothetical protein B6U88_01090 [Candidatus Aenigmarchaeota archaeon ex4484_56]
MEPGNEKSAFIDINNIYLDKNMLKILKPKKQISIGSEEYKNDETEKKLYGISIFEIGISPMKPVKIKINNKDIKVHDFLIDPTTWRICQLMYGFLFFRKILPIEKVTYYNEKENCYIFE